MATQTKLSRFSPAYLASRHAGAIALLATLGLLIGMAWRSLVQPTRYFAETEITVAVEPMPAAASFNWNGKREAWRDLLRDKRRQGILEGNLRHALKLAATQGMALDTETLSEHLAQFGQGVAYSASLFRHSLAARLGPTVEIKRNDLAMNLDFQSLAAIICDLDPAPEAVNWDFTFFNDTPIIAALDSLVVEPGPADRYFRVFYRLYASLNEGREASTPVEAWQTAIDTLNERLEREAKFAGGGGFGHTAKRELIREISSIPALAANGLYFGNLWLIGQAEFREDAMLWEERWERGTFLDLERNDAATGILRVSMALELNPLSYPRDTVLTRLPPMALSTLLSFLAASEKHVVVDERPAAVSVSEIRPAADPVPEKKLPPTTVAYREVVDEKAAKRRADGIAGLEAAVTKTGMDRNDALRRLETARNNETRLSREAIAARARADRFRERLDETALAATRDTSPRIPPETAALFAKRDSLLRRLTELLEYCTEEHPFVKEARRELESAEAMLADHKPDPAANREAELRAMRLASLKLEYEAAEETAEGLEERARMQGEAVACLLEEAANLERDLTRKELELSRARETPVPMLRLEMAAATPVPEPVPAPPPAAPAQPPASPSPSPEAVRLAFVSMPVKIPLRAVPPPWSAPLCGVLAGLALGMCCMLLREAFASRLDSPAEAARLVKLPVLAALPAYDMKSVREAAATIQGDLAKSFTGQLLFTPAQIELTEPPALARRGKIRPARRRMRALPWIFALVFLLLAALLHYKSQIGFAHPVVSFSGELPLPAETVRMWADESDAVEDWGNLP